MLKTKLLYMPPSKKREDNLPLWLHPLSSLYLPLTVNVTPVSARLLCCYCYLNPISISQPSIKLFSLTIILPQIILYTSSFTVTHGLALSIPPSDPSGSSMASRAGLQRGMEKPPSPETSRESSTNGPWCRGPRRRGGLTHSPQSQLQPHQQEAA